MSDVELGRTFFIICLIPFSVVLFAISIFILVEIFKYLGRK